MKYMFFIINVLIGIISLYFLFFLTLIFDIGGFFISKIYSVIIKNFGFLLKYEFLLVSIIIFITLIIVKKKLK